MKLPEAFISYTREMMGEELFAAFMKGMQQPASVSVRLNPLKIGGGYIRAEQTAEGIRAEQTAEGICKEQTAEGICKEQTAEGICKEQTAEGIREELEAEQVPWCRHGYYLQGRPHFTFDPLLHAGCYYVQEAASMFVDEVIRQHVHGPVVALDLCAAPGGKSTALLAALPTGSVLVSNEPMRQRAHILSENLQKWGHADVLVTNNLPSDIRQTGVIFDLILTDVPCSGEGMFRKDAEAIGEWSTQHVLACQRLQRDIVEEAWQCLRPGGLLIYSTCTFNLHEDEENILWAVETLGAEVLPVATHEDWHVTPSLSDQMKDCVCRFIPGITRGEGLFMAVLQKPETVPLPPSLQKPQRKKEKQLRQREKNQKNDKASASSIMTWLSHPELFTLRENGDDISAIPTRWMSLYEQMSGLRILHAGVGMGSRRGKDLLPAQSLALSPHLNPAAFATCEIDHAQAMSYLRKEAVVLPHSIPRGFVLLTYRGVGLGFVKNIGSRANNLYPQEWKIRSGYLPEGLCEIM